MLRTYDLAGRFLVVPEVPIEASYQVSAYGLDWYKCFLVCENGYYS